MLCDVENVLLGEGGASTVFGPQKGANSEDVKRLEASLTRLRGVIFQQTGKDIAVLKYGGAAGGVAAGIAGLLNAELVNGIDYFLSFTNFDTILAGSDIVITGEGSIDIQTLNGKGPFGVAKKAKEQRKPVIGLAGTIQSMGTAALDQYFDVLLSINNEVTELSSALLNTRNNLVKTAKAVGNLLALASGSKK